MSFDLILYGFCRDNFDNESPFHPNDFVRQDSDTSIDDNGNHIPAKPLTIEKFQEVTADIFDELIKEIKEDDFNVIALVTKWIQNISRFWERKIPIEILDLYLKLYQYHS